MDSVRLQQIYDDAGAPGVQAFRFAARRKGVQISETEAKAFVAKQSTGQIHQGRIPSDGKIVGGGRENMRWQMDLIDGSKRIRKHSRSHRFVRVAVDNYNRQVFDFLEKHHITPVITPFRHRWFWDGGVHCVTQDLYREGEMEDYFHDGKEKQRTHRIALLGAAFQIKGSAFFTDKNCRSLFIIECLQQTDIFSLNAQFFQCIP